MWSRLNSFQRLVGVDLGSQMTRIWTSQDGVVVDEPSCLAVDVKNKKVVAVGQEAAEMQGRVKASVQVHWPIIQGKVSDLQLTKAMLQLLLQKVFKFNLLSPIMMVSVPANSTKLMRQTVRKLFLSLGAKEVYLITQPLAAAIGTGVPIADASGCFLVQLGAGLVEGAIISLGSLVAAQTSKKAGQQLDKLISLKLKQQHQLQLSLSMAEHLKQAIGSLDLQTNH
ncbi:MAG: hypothetical protein GF390_02955, partial [Candidatus Pacebacteria bacterium]|nr:hypothetical protein [Candidatus Paceibacterota bacterium]